MNNIKLLEEIKADTIILCGSAPSLRLFSPSMLRNEGSASIVALNNAYLNKDINFDAVVSADYTAIKKNINDLINTPNLIKLFGRVKGPEDSILPEEFLNGEDVVSFKVDDTTDNKTIFTSEDFCLDIRNSPLRFTKSVALTAMQIILWLRPKQIYLVGLDFSKEGHFNDDVDDVEYNARHKMWVAEHWETETVRKIWKELKLFAKRNYPDTEVISVNPVTLRGIFHDVYMDCNVPSLTAYIGVKEHSVRLPGKNTLPFGDSNLLIHKIRQMKRAMNIGKIVVSTDSPEMLRMAADEGVDGIRRPVEYANETRPYQEFVRYLTEVLPGEHIMRCPVTAPLCDADVLNDSISKYFWAIGNGYDSLTSVLPFQHHMLDENGPMNYTMDVNHKGSQNLPLWHEIANCMDIEPMDIMKKSLFQFGPNFYRYEVDKIAATDIDDRMDYEIACAIYKHMKVKEDE